MSGLALPWSANEMMPTIEAVTAPKTYANHFIRSVRIPDSLAACSLPPIACRCRPITVQLITTQTRIARITKAMEMFVTSLSVDRRTGSGKSICDLPFIMIGARARPKLRRPTKVASVAMNGGSPMAVISHACNVPIMTPTINVPPIDKSIVDVPKLPAAKPSGSSVIINEPNTVALSAMTEPLERSMPPEMMITALPSAKKPNKTVFRRISSADPAVWFQ